MEEHSTRQFKASDISVMGSFVYRCEFNFPRDLEDDDISVEGDTIIKHDLRFQIDAEFAYVRLEIHADLTLGGQASPVCIGAEFKYHVDGLQDYLIVDQGTEERRVDVDETFASILIGISLSTMRGIWSGFARQTPFPDLHIRVYDPKEVLSMPVLED